MGKEWGWNGAVFEQVPQIYNEVRGWHGKGDNRISPIVAFGRDEATRTPDPYVPNVVRYQLRYIPFFENRVQRYSKKMKYKQF